MRSFSRYNRRGAKARRTTNQPAGRMLSPEYPQKHPHKASHDHKPPHKGSHSPTTLARTDRTWADAARASLGSNTAANVMLLTYHTVAKDLAVPYSFAAIPHLLITGKYSGSSDNQNELVFMHVFPAGQPATRELLQRYRTEAHVEIRKRLGINMFFTDALGYTITVVTRKNIKGIGS